MNALIVLLFISGAWGTLLTSARDEDEIDPCQNVASGQTIPVVGTSSDFYLCVDKKSFKLSCGTMEFNPKSHICEHSQASWKAHLCDERATGDLIASTENCSDYFVCIGKMVAARTCGWMHFDAKIGKCVDSRYSNCDQSKLRVQNRPVVKFMPSGSEILVPILIRS